MAKLLISLAALILSASSVVGQEARMGNEDELKWADNPALPKGGQTVVVFGDPAKEGPFTLRVRFPANYRIPPHSHPGTEVVTVLSGDFHFGMGSTFDENKVEHLKPGGFAVMPKGMQHYAWSRGGTVIQVNAQGPWAVNYVNPADDPRKSQ